jgi:hypothetical protein
VFGGSAGAATFGEEGNLYRFVSGGTNPAATGADKVIASYTLPAGSFDIAGRGLVFQALGTFVSNANTKDCKLYFNCTTATVGQTVTGGTVIADSGSFTTGSPLGWQLTAQVFKYGATGSNTQVGQNTGIIVANTHSGMGVPILFTANESAPIIMALTLNTNTAATDLSANFFEVNALN